MADASERLAIVPRANPDETGLRRRKKAKQKAQLLAAATELFRTRGFEETRMEDVGRMADVSLKTVYNYFPTKQAILIELIREDRTRMMSLYEAILAQDHADLTEALLKLIRTDIGNVVTPSDRKLWRELLAAEIRASVDSVDEYEKNREIFSAYIRQMLMRFRQRGDLSRSINIAVAVDMVYALLAYNFRIYVVSTAMTIEDVERALRAQLRMLVMDWSVQASGAASRRLRQPQ